MDLSYWPPQHGSGCSSGPSRLSFLHIAWHHPCWILASPFLSQRLERTEKIQIARMKDPRTKPCKASGWFSRQAEAAARINYKVNSSSITLNKLPSIHFAVSYKVHNLRITWYSWHLDPWILLFIHIPKKKYWCGVDTAVNINKKAYGIVSGSYFFNRPYFGNGRFPEGWREGSTISHGSSI